MIPVAEPRYPVSEKGLKCLKLEHWLKRTRYKEQDLDERLFQTDGNHYEDFEYFPSWHYESLIEEYERLLSDSLDQPANPLRVEADTD